MRICALTMVYRDYWALGQWYAHFSRHLGAGNLFVVSHGADPKIAEICPGASILTIPREDMKGFDRKRGRMLNAFQDGLGELYDWVIRTDADELICLDPEHYGSFADFFDRQSARAVFALGLNVAEADGDAPLKAGENVLAQRRAAMFSGHYSKAWAVRDRVALMRHGVELRPRRVNRFEYCMPPGVYLVHLKYASLAALKEANAHRRAIATGGEKGLPGSAWRKPEKDAAKFFAVMSTLPETGWDEARDEAYGTLSTNPRRDVESGLVRSHNISFGFRTTLPDWFGQ